MSQNIKKGYFTLKGKPAFIISGEVQYFRLEKKLWEKHIHNLKKAGCNTLSTYIPWNWHERSKSNFDFTGKTHPSRDLIGFLDLVERSGLKLIVKPGPHIHAEFLNGGLPLRILKDHPEILSLDSNGKESPVVFYPIVTYMHPEYMDEVKVWFSSVLPLLKDRKNILFFQADNEVSYHTSFISYSCGQAFNGDYNPFLIKNGLYQKYLKDLYGTIGALNKRYGEKNQSFARVRPPVREPKDRKESFKVYDWVGFREHLAGLYMRELISMMYSLDVPGPYAVNDPLLGYSTSWPELFKQCQDPRWDLMLGYTHYQGNVQEESISAQPGKISHVFASGSPIAAGMEIQSSDAYFFPHCKQTLSDHRLIWKLAPAGGANLFNYYWFADGENFDGFHHLTKELCLQSPVNKKGETRNHFNTLQTINRYLARNPDLAETKPVYDLALGFYHPYSRYSRFFARLEAGTFGNGDGLTTLMSMCDIHFGCTNLESKTPVKEKTIVFFCQPFLSAEIQSRLVRLAKEGKKIVLISTIPEKDESMKSCTILKDAMGLLSIQSIPSGGGAWLIHRIKYKNLTVPVQSGLKAFQFKTVSGIKKDIIREYTNQVCGFTKKTGKGSLSVIGFEPRVMLDPTRSFIRSYFGKKSEDHIYIYERRKGKTRFFTIINLKDTPVKKTILGKTVSVGARDASFLAIRS